MNANFLRYQVLPAQAGIEALTDNLEKELMEAVIREAAQVWGMRTVYEGGQYLIWDKANRHLYRCCYDLASNLHWARSTGKGTHGTVWDGEDWTNTFEVPQAVLDIFAEADIPNKVNAFRQDLTANSEVLQKAAKMDAALTKKVNAIHARASRLEDKHGYASFSTCFDSWEGDEHEHEVIELVGKTKFYCTEYVDFMKAIFEMWLEAAEDGVI